MAAPQGTVRVRQDGPTVTFQVEDWGRMVHGLPMRRFAERALEGGAAVLRVDLRHCDYMDSTFLGTLLCLKRLVEQRGGGRFALVEPSPKCRQLLRQMGVDAFLPVVAAEGPEPAAGWAELPTGLEDLDAFKGNVVQAHQALAELDGPASATFRDVLRSLGQDVKAGKER